MPAPRRWITPTIVWTLTVVVAAGALVLRVPGLAPLLSDPRVGTDPLVRAHTAPTPTPVLPALATPTAHPDAAALAARIAAVPADGLGEVSAVVVDAVTGEVVHRIGEGAQTPASSLKVLTSLVALDVLGPEHRFTTTVLRAPDGTLVLRGGGDPLLAVATRDAYPYAPSLAELAERTAAALHEAQVTSVALGYDDSLFSGPAWNPAWPETFRTSVAPITALTADHAHPDLTRAERAADPSLFAAERFADLLRAQGIAVTALSAQATPADAVAVASLDSLPVATIVEQVLLNSDNDAAETLLWQVALAKGRAAGPASAPAVLAEELAARGLWSQGMAVADGNGISAGNRVTPDALAEAIVLAAREPQLRALVTGLPVAGVSGTLDDRFTAEDALAGRGVVRAKTGTIRSAHSLTGYTVTADGQPLAFAFLVEGGAGQTSARAWLDGVTAALAGCGC